MSSNQEITQKLKQNYFLYRKMSRIPESYFKKGNYEKTLEWIETIAIFSWMHHSGLFADGRIENLALEVGKALKEIEVRNVEVNLPLAFLQTSLKKKVLHIATTVYPIGGHTRLIKNWINTFNAFEHSLLLTNQGEKIIPDFLKDEIIKSGGDWFKVPSELKLLEKSQIIRRAACQNFDYIFLHHHPNDVLPIVAFADENCPPVATINHADHIFWLGSSVSDLIIDYCRLGNVLSQTRRSAKKSTIVPYLLEFPNPKMTRAEARRELGIGDDEIVLITIGTAYKYEPTDKHNFFSTAKKILDRNKAAKLFLIGPNKSIETEKCERMIFTGIINDTTLYQIAADIYLDGFPLGGGISSVESVMLDVCPVFAYGQLLDSSPRKLLEFENIVEVRDTEAEYIEQVNELIQNSDLRRRTTKKIKSWIISLHSRDKFPDYFKATFDYLDGIKHRPQKIPDLSPEVENADISLMIRQNSQPQSVSKVLKCAWSVLPTITLSELFRLMIVSFQAGDMKIARSNLRGWFGTIKCKLNGEQLAEKMKVE